MIENFCNDGVAPLLDVNLIEERSVSEALYQQYSAGIRFYLTRRNSSLAMEHAVIEIVIDASRAICRTPGVVADDHPSILLQCTRRHAALIPRANRETDHLNLARPLLSRLSSAERAILSMAYVLNHSDSRIAPATGRSTAEISEIRHRVRDQFRQLRDVRGVTNAAVN